MNLSKPPPAIQNYPDLFVAFTLINPAQTNRSYPNLTVVSLHIARNSQNTLRNYQNQPELPHHATLTLFDLMIYHKWICTSFPNFGFFHGNYFHRLSLIKIGLSSTDLKLFLGHMILNSSYIQDNNLFICFQYPKLSLVDLFFHIYICSLDFAGKQWTLDQGKSNKIFNGMYLDVKASDRTRDNYHDFLIPVFDAISTLSQTLKEKKKLLHSPSMSSEFYKTFNAKRNMW